MNRTIAILLAGVVFAAPGFGAAATPTATTTSLSIAPSGPVQLGTQVTLTARVTPTPDGGTVTFYNGVQVLGTVAVSSGTAVLNEMDFTPSPAAAPFSITASYNGDTNFAASTSATAVNLAVTAAASSVFVPSSFTPPLVKNSGAPARTVQGDFNHDGIMDLAIYGSGGIVIAKGNGPSGGPGDGTFTIANGGAVLTGSQACIDVVVGDFNVDGNPDLACYRRSMTAIDVFLGNGDETFGTPTTLTVEGDALGNATGQLFGTMIVAADFNGDGNVDLGVPVQVLASCSIPGVGNFPCLEGAVNTFLGKGDGTFPTMKASVVFSPSPFAATGGEPIAMVGGDFNKDGVPDVLVVALGGSAFDLYFMPGNGTGSPAKGDGTFTTATAGLSAPGFNPVNGNEQLVAADFAGSGSPQVLYRDGNGVIYVAVPSVRGSTVTFTYQSTTPTNAKAPNGFLAIGDFNGDGNLDIAGDFQGTNRFQLMYGSGNDKFSITQIPAVGNCGTSVYPVSFNYNGDHRSDLAAFCSNNSLTILLGSPPPGVTLVSPATAAAGGSIVNLILTGTSFQSGDTLTWTPVGSGSPTPGIPTTFNQNGTLSVSITGAQATSLLASQGPVKLDVVDPSGVSSSSAQNFAVAPPPALSSLAPASAPAGSSSAVSVTLTGTNFVNGDCVTWTQVTPQAAAPVSLTGTSPCNTTVTSAGAQQQITVQVPTSQLALVGTANITVIDPDLAPSTTPQTFTVLAPTISGLADSTGAVLTSVGTASSDLQVTVNGSNFVSGVSSNTGSVVVFTDPGGAQHVLSPSSVDPTGTSLIVTVPGADIGSVANTTAKLQVLNQAPGGACSAPGVTGACSAQLTLAVGAPKITSVNPAAATTGGSNLPITVNGTNFVANSQLVWCNNCNGTPQTSIVPTAVSPGQMTLTIPGSLLNAAGTANISVTNTPGSLTNTNTNSPAVQFQISTLAISSITPTSVIAGGGAFTLTINGQNSNFDNGASVLFGSGLQPILPSQQAGATITSNQIIITVPASYIASPGTLQIQVQDSNGTQSQTVQLPVNTFSITNVAPLNLVAGSPDTVLTITGTGFGATDAMQIQWLEGTTTTSLPILTNSNGQITVKVPGGAQGLLAQPGNAQIIAVQTVSGTPITTTFTQPVTISGPVVSTLSPTSALVNGNAFLLTVSGSNFLSTSTVQWTDYTGKVTQLNTNFTSSTTLTAFVPASPLLSLPASETALVSVANGSVVSNGVVFQIGPVPTILTNGTGVSICTTTSNCNPASSITAGAGDTTLQITGTNYQPGAIVIWSANGTSTNLVTSYQSGTSLLAILPASILTSPVAALITVQDPGPPASTSNGVLFTVGNGPTPTLSSVTAVGNVILGSPIQLVLTGTNFSNGAQVQWNNGPTTTALATVFADSADLTAVVPSNLVAAPGTVTISVLSAGATSNQKSFTIPAITITSISPNTASTGSGLLSMTVMGGNFSSNSVVQWTGGAGPVALATTVVGPTQLTALVPAAQFASAGTAFVSVVTGTLTTNALPFTVTAAPSTAPTIFTDGTGLGICPGGANCRAGTSVVAGSPSIVLQVAGLNYQPQSVVVWTANGTPTNLITAYNFPTTTNPNATLQATVPASLLASPGTALITVLNPDKTASNGVLFSVGAGQGPTISSLSISSVQAGGPGSQITVVGTNYSNGAVVMWNGGGTPQALTTAFVSSTQLTALIPSSLIATPATVFLSVQNPNGGGLSNLMPFTVSAIAPPSIASVSPATAAAGSSGVTLILAGTNFANGAVVMWNAGTATPLATGFSSATQLTALVPASLLALPGTALISVQNPDKTTTNAVTFSITGSAPVAAPTLTSIAPTSAAAGSGTIQLTVIGQNFVGPTANAAGTVVQWNGTALPTTFSSTTQLVVTVDASLLQAVGANFVSAVTGTNSSAGVKFQVNAPTLTTIAPASAIAGGPAFSLTLTGTNFVSGSVAVWNTTKLSTAVNSATSLTAQVTPDLIATTGSAFILVTNPGGAATGPQIFTISTPPSSTVTTLSPPSAVAGGAAFQLTVNGTGFVNGSVVMWNGSPLGTGFISATQITALIDSSLVATAGSANIAVQNPGAAISTAVKFPINGPTVTTLTPSTANAGDPGFTLTVAGTNFIPGASVMWNGSILPTLYSGATQLQATVPATLIASAGAASVTVQNPGGAASGIVTFTIGPPSLHITTAVLPDGIVGTAYSQVLAASGGSQPYAWTVSSGNLAGGLGLDPASGTISGTPTGAANGTIGFTVTDAAGRIAKVSLQLNIALALTITTPSPLTMATAGTAYSAQLAATGGTPSYLWSIAGNLPPGLIFNVATGRISGVPTAPGSYTFTIGVTDSRQQQNATAPFTLPVTVAALNVSGLNANVGPAQQVPLTVSVPNAYPVDLTGTLTLTFASAVGGDDPSIQFSTIGRTVTFTIPNGTTTAVYPQNQQLLVSTGTVAGTITIKATLQAAGSDITPSSQTPVTAAVPKQVPVITAATLKQTTGGVVVAITGYTTTKEVTQATLQFNAVSGGNLNSGTTTVPLTAVLNSWFQSATAAQFGGQFTVSVPIAVSGTVSAIGSVTVTVTNTQGNSAPVTAPLQ